MVSKRKPILDRGISNWVPRLKFTSLFDATNTNDDSEQKYNLTHDPRGHAAQADRAQDELHVRGHQGSASPLLGEEDVGGGDLRTFTASPINHRRNGQRKREERRPRGALNAERRSRGNPLTI